MKKSLINIFPLLFLVCGLPPFLVAQLPATYLCFLRNDSLLSLTVYEFDLYLQNTDNINTFELAAFQSSFIVNSAIRNSGTITASIVAGTSQLSAAQTPATILFDNTKNSVQLAPKSPPGHGSGTLISRTTPGLRVCRVRLTNTASFGQAQPNLSFLYSIDPYRTAVAVYNQTSGTDTIITNQSFFSTLYLNNPALNAAIPAFTVSGTGSYCSGETGRTISLSSSTVGLRYQLKRDGIKDGAELSGTGNALTWTNRLAGTYTVVARRPATYMTANMTGNAVVTELSRPMITLTGEDTVCQGPAVHMYATQTGMTDYQWTVSTGGTIVTTGGATTDTVGITWQIPGSQMVSVNYIAINGCSALSPQTFMVTVLQLPPPFDSLKNITIHDNEISCTGAVQEITVGGNGTTFIVESGGQVTLVAGQTISMKSGAKVNTGGYLHAHINPNCPSCQYAPNKSVVVFDNEITKIEVPRVHDPNILFYIYPNPTPGTFKLELTNDPSGISVSMELFNMLGTLIKRQMFYSGKIHECSLENEISGIYLIRVIQNGQVGIKKVIKQ